MIHDERIQQLNDAEIRSGDFVLYWMQASQRAEYNHALEYAIRQANELKQPLAVFFGITDEFPNANLRHYHFMLQGLRQTRQSLRERDIQMVIRHISPDKGAVQLAKEASLVVTDRGYLRIQVQWRDHLAEHIQAPLIQVETDCIVPIETASEKENYSAGVLRPRIHRQWENFLVPLKSTKVKKSSLNMKFDSFDISDTDTALAQLKIDREVKPIETWHGGTAAAKKLLKDFIKNKLNHYPDKKNDPSLDHVSHMSPYLHFGQISPLYIALEVLKTKSPGRDAFLEELIVRRELAQNFVHYNPHYDSYKCLPHWAVNTLRFHKKDKRPYTYTLQQLETAQTHDPYWNAAQTQMVLTGKMHGYMRMYWGKKLLEWCNTPRTAFQWAVYLNDKYELDGRDPNGYAGIAWCFGKHDRPWPERPVFGKVRYMADSGLKRKCNIDTYVNNVDSLTAK